MIVSVICFQLCAILEFYLGFEEPGWELSDSTRDQDNVARNDFVLVPLETVQITL